ncbi:hypothetical protein JCM24511_04507 [Saitozyma sp. JCM 24511]|nr:hypothetical protein JCM24511_04507 [Saitozyma sp. JCM 24511]
MISVDEVGLLPEGELRDTLVPALDHAADTLGKCVGTHDLGDEGGSAVAGGVELGPVKEGADVCGE